jgi:hypothetical protein
MHGGEKNACPPIQPPAQIHHPLTTTPLQSNHQRPPGCVTPAASGDVAAWFSAPTSSGEYEMALSRFPECVWAGSPFESPNHPIAYAAVTLTPRAAAPARTATRVLLLDSISSCGPADRPQSGGLSVQPLSQRKKVLFPQPPISSFLALPSAMPWPQLPLHALSRLSFHLCETEIILWKAKINLSKAPFKAWLGPPHLRRARCL